MQQVLYNTKVLFIAFYTFYKNGNKCRTLEVYIL